MKSSFTGVPNTLTQTFTSSFPGEEDSSLFQVVSDGNARYVEVYQQSQGDKIQPNPQSYAYGRYSKFLGTTRLQHSSGGYSSTLTREGIVFDETPYFPGYLDSSGAYNKALSQLYDKLRGSVDLSVSIAEAGQVRRMVKKTTQAVNLIRGINPKTWHNHWLEYQYGWRPLLSDIHGAIDQLSRTAGGALALKARASENENWSERIEPNGTYMPEWISQRDFKQSARVEIYIYFQPYPNLVTDLAYFSSLNPLSIAWELLPYSFVVDWFLGVGQWLRAIETSLAFPGDVKSGYVTTTVRTTAKEQRLSTGRTDESGYSFDCFCEAFNIAGTKTRTTLGSLPLPRAPTFKVNLSSTRLISAASLLAQHLGTGPKIPRR